MTIFKGSAPALIAPFKNDKIDFDSFSRLINLQLTNGSAALIVNGTTGEPTTMTRAERAAMTEFVVKEAKGKVPVIAGAGSNNTHTAVEYAKEAEKLGANGILAVTPYYNKCTQEGAFRHYIEIADSVGIPVVLYNVPGRTGFNLEPETIARLSEHKNIVAFKEASDSMKQIMEVARLTQGAIDLYSGNDDLVYPMLTLGGAGVISVAANIAPKFMADFCSAYFNGNYKTALDMHFKLLPLVKALFCEVNPIPVKYAAYALGLIESDYMRLPLTEFTKKDVMNKELKAFGLLN
jgi:4-hydroxy-tetrahydrodipicolinate synthase